MKVTRRSHFTGKVRTLDLPVTSEQLIRLDEGEMIQAVLPHLSDDQREFLISGVTADEWETFLGGGER